MGDGASEAVRILCVDDEPNVLKSLRRLFIECDYEIITAESGAAGLEIIEGDEPVQIVISDYRMPQMNGVDFLKAVREKRPEVIRIVLSGFADTSAMVEAINEGKIYKFIPKPWNDDELKIEISKALEYFFTTQKNIRLTEALEEKNTELVEINNSLERLVRERTADLVMQNRILTASQNILDSLPVGVVGVDPEGLIVQCNRKGLEMFSMPDGNILGLDRQEYFSEGLNTLIDSVTELGSVDDLISVNGNALSVMGRRISCDNGQEGIILVLQAAGA
ncbi:MAG: response regulator [Nitrospira sp.]|nr:response regulator [bacterium]MBL7048403.1 response regulator [Nitrospira sp.]